MLWWDEGQQHRRGGGGEQRRWPIGPSFPAPVLPPTRTAAHPSCQTSRAHPPACCTRPAPPRCWACGCPRGSRPHTCTQGWQRIGQRTVCAEGIAWAVAGPPPSWRGRPAHGCHAGCARQLHPAALPALPPALTCSRCGRGCPAASPGAARGTAAWACRQGRAARVWVRQRQAAAGAAHHPPWTLAGTVTAPPGGPQQRSLTARACTPPGFPAGGWGAASLSRASSRCASSTRLSIDPSTPPFTPPFTTSPPTHLGDLNVSLQRGLLLDQACKNGVSGMAGHVCDVHGTGVCERQRRAASAPAPGHQPPHPHHPPIGKMGARSSAVSGCRVAGLSGGGGGAGRSGL